MIIYTVLRCHICASSCLRIFNLLCLPLTKFVCDNLTLINNDENAGEKPGASNLNKSQKYFTNIYKKNTKENIH